MTLKTKSTVLVGFFPYLGQMITSIRGCVAHNDLWPWPISSRSFGLGLENRVCSVAYTVLDGFFPYLVQMITSMRRCVACDDLWLSPISSKVIRPWLRKSCPLCSVYSSGRIIFIYGANDHYYYSVCRVLRFFQNLEIWIFGKFFENFRPWRWKKSTVLDGFFLYLVQMITSMKGCGAYNDLWHWPISSRSFGIGLENRVRSVASRVRHGLFPY